METAKHYRTQAERARRLAAGLSERETETMLVTFAREYDELAEDLESGAVEIRHRELMPQWRRKAAGSLTSES